MKVKALRGVCIGVERHLQPGDTAEDLEPGLVTYLVNIGAVERVPEPVVMAPPAPELDLKSEADPKPDKSKAKDK